MNQHTTLKHRTAQILFVIAAFSVTASAEAACRRYDFVCKALAGIKSVTATTVDAVEDLLDDAEQKVMQETVANLVKGTYAYGPNKSVIDKAVLDARALDASQKAAFVTAAQNAYEPVAGKVKAIKLALDNMDSAGKRALTRLQVTAVSIVGAKVDGAAREALLGQAREDLLLVANKLALKLGQANVPNSVTNSTFGVFVAVSAYVVGGLAGSVGMVVDLAPQNGKHSVGAFLSLGGAVGVNLGAGGGLGISWAPGTVAETTGAYVGTGVELKGAVGVGLDASWSVAKGMSGAEKAIPGVSIQAGPGAEVRVANVGGGYTFLFAKN